MERKPPDIMAEIRRLRGKLQSLQTVLMEQGVELDPATPTSLQVRPGIGRTWATLWGRDKSSLRIVGVDRIGQLIVRPVDFQASISIGKTNSTDASGFAQIDMGEVVDFVAIEARTAARVKVYFGMTSSDLKHWRYLHQEGSGGASPTSRGEYFHTCRHLYFVVSPATLGEVINVVGEVFPKQ